MPLEEIERRLGAAVTVVRADDLGVGGNVAAASTGEGIEDLTVANNGPSDRWPSRSSMVRLGMRLSQCQITFSGVTRSTTRGAVTGLV